MSRWLIALALITGVSSVALAILAIGQGFNESSAAWAQAVYSVVAIVAAILLQAHYDQRGRASRKAAYLALSEIIISSIAASDKKLKAGAFTRGNIKHHIDEAASNIEAMRAIPLDQIGSADMIVALKELRTAQTTAHRRLELARGKIRSGAVPAPQQLGRPLRDARVAQAALKKAKT